MEKISFLKQRFNDFWYPLYDFEQDEINCLNNYLNYVIKNLKIKSAQENDYKINLLNFLMQKHISYVNEAYSSLLLGNFNACASLLRIMMENYVTFIILKKYEKEEIWKDFLFWSFYKKIEQLKKNGLDVSHSDYENLEKMLGKLRAELSYFSNINVKNYGWLEHLIDNKSATFQQACKLANVDIYHDFTDLSSYIHSNDFITKMNWLDMTTLTKFIFLIYTYMDKMIIEYDRKFIKRKKYCSLEESLFHVIEFANHFSEIG